MVTQTSSQSRQVVTTPALFATLGTSRDLEQVLRNKTKDEKLTVTIPQATAIWDSPQVSSRFLSSECFEKSHSNYSCLHFHNSKIDCYLTREKKLNPFNFTRRNQRLLDTCLTTRNMYHRNKTDEFVLHEFLPTLTFSFVVKTKTVVAIARRQNGKRSRKVFS